MVKLTGIGLGLPDRGSVLLIVLYLVYCIYCTVLTVLVCIQYMAVQ